MGRGATAGGAPTPSLGSGSAVCLELVRVASQKDLTLTDLRLKDVVIVACIYLPLWDRAAQDHSPCRQSKKDEDHHVRGVRSCCWDPEVVCAALHYGHSDQPEPHAAAGHKVSRGTKVVPL